MEIIKFNSFINTLKDFINIKNNNLSFLKEGDVIWAKRYNSLEEKNHIRFGHQEGPFVVIKKQKGKVYVLPASSNQKDYLKWKKQVYPLGRFTYGFKKNTYVTTTKTQLLNDYNYIKVLTHLTEYDFNKLKKYLYLVLKSNIRHKLDLMEKDVKFTYEIGDVIKYNNERYYICDIDKKNFYVNKYIKNMKKGNYIVINNTTYSFLFQKIDTISLKEEVTLVDTFNRGEIKLLNKFKNKMISAEAKELQVGSIIESLNFLYYVYEISDSKIKCYKLANEKYPYNKRMNALVVGDGCYYTFFTKIDLLKTDDYKVKRVASYEEIKENFKMTNMKSKDSNKYKDILLNKPKETIESIVDFEPLMIIKNKINKNYYLILERNGNVIELVNINNMSDCYEYLLEDNNCPFEFYQILDVEEFKIYQKKINELKEFAESLK